MLKFKEFLNESLLIERSSVVDYFLKNPNKMKTLDIEISKKASNIDIYDSIKFMLSNSYSFKKLQNRMAKIEKKFETIQKKLDSEYKAFNPSSWLDIKYITNLEHFLKDKEKNKDSKTPVFDKFKPQFLEYTKLSNIKRQYTELYIEKLSLQFGIKSSTLLDALKEITKYRSMSGQKIDPKAIPAIRELTVKDTPRKIYRGWFLDGEKLAKIKGIERLGVNDTFTFNFGKPSSWTTVKEIAYSFAVAQDMVKDTENGYMMVISYEPTFNDIIADFRSPILSNITGFYNQQEILLNTGKKTFKIEWIHKGDDWKATNKVNTGSVGGVSNISSRNMTINILTSTTKNSAAKKFIREFEIADKLSKLTVSEVLKLYPSFTTMYEIAELDKHEMFRLIMILNKANLSIESKISKDKFILTKYIDDYTDGYKRLKTSLTTKISGYNELFKKPKMSIEKMQVINEKNNEEIEVTEKMKKSLYINDYFDISW